MSSWLPCPDKKHPLRGCENVGVPRIAIHIREDLIHLGSRYQSRTDKSRPSLLDGPFQKKSVFPLHNGWLVDPDIWLLETCRLYLPYIHFYITIHNENSPTEKPLTAGGGSGPKDSQ